MSDKLLRILAVSILIFVGLNASVAGVLFLMDTIGALIGLSTEYIKYSPFSNYLIPGLTLLVLIGLFSLYSAYATMKKKARYPYLILAEGVLLGGWILIQMWMVKDVNWLHVLMLTFALLLLLLGNRLRTFKV